MASAIMSLFLGALAPHWTLRSAESWACVGWPTLKVDAETYAVAAEVAKRTPSDMSALAPEEVALWIPTIPGHPPLVVVRSHYLQFLVSELGEGEVARRLRLEAIVSGEERAPDDAAFIQTAVRELNLGSVVLGPKADEGGAIGRVLFDEGFRMSSPGNFRLWVRAAPVPGKAEVAERRLGGS